MAINSQRRLDELQKQCADLGLTVVNPGKRPGKTEYILALREFFYKRDFPNGKPKMYQLLDERLESGPQLAARLANMPAEYQDPKNPQSPWNDKRWCAQTKMDGMRAVMGFFGGELHMTSRNTSVDTFRVTDYSENLWLDYCKDGLSKIEDEFLLDAELVSLNPKISTVLGKRGTVCECMLQAVTALMALNPMDSIKIQKEENAPIEFGIFDCLWYNGEWLIDRPYIERVKYARKAIAKLQAAGLKCKEPAMRYTNRKAFYDAIVATGGEGVILKNLLAPYRSGARDKTAWLKVKRTVGEAAANAGIGDTIDGWISGFEPGDPEKSNADLVGSVDISCKLKMLDGTIKDHVIARVSNLSLETRRAMTEYDENGKPRMKKEWYGRMCEISMQAISSRALRGKHAVLVQFRPDKDGDFDSTLLTEEFLRSQVL